jgi:8-oxo-dGTP pyrophosphatase MutT (NUDIX family)
VEFARVFRREQVRQRVSSAVRPRSPLLAAAVARIWESELALAEDADRELYNGELGRFISAEVGEDSLRFTLGCISYREFLGTNLFNAAAVGREGVEYFADPLGVSVVVVTLDGWLALGRRGRRVAFHAGWLHPFGGMLESSDRQPKGTYDLFGCARRELMEELGARAHEIGETLVLGLVRDRAIHQPELIFRSAIKLKRGELDAVFDPRFSDGEHDAIEFVADTPDGVMEAIETVDSVTAVAQASLLLHGRDRWGEEWYASARRRLYE